MSEVDSPRNSTVFIVNHGLRDYDQIDRVFGRSIATNLRFLRHVYGVTVSALDRESGDLDDIQISGLYRADTWQSLIVLRQEIAKYPPEYIKEYLQRIRLTSALSIPHPLDIKRQLNIGGRASRNGLVYLGQHYRDEPYTRQTVHHEIAHAPDLVEEWEKNQTKVDKWMASNPRRNVYIGEDYWGLTKRQSREFSTRGFARLYGRINILEDRATTTEDLMSTPTEAYKRAEGDSSYKSKLDQIIADFAKRTNNRMGDQYFEDLAASRVSEGYWKTNKVRALYISCWAEIDYRRGAHKKTFKQIARN